MRALLLGLLLLLTACAAPTDGLQAEPRELWATPQATRYQVTLINPGSTDRQLSNLRIEGADWGAFSITNTTNPDLIPARGFVSIDLRVSRRAFSTQAGDGYQSYRSGEAVLRFDEGGAPRTVPLHFRPTPQTTQWLINAPVPIVALAIALWLAVWVSRRVGKRLRETHPLTTRELDGFTSANGYAVAMAGLALAFATVPVGAGLCFAALDTPVSGPDLAACASGLGGAPLAVAPGSAGAVLWLGGVIVYLSARFAEGDARARALSLDAMRAAGVVAAAYAATLVSFGTLDPGQLVELQGHGFELVGIQIARWGAFAQPVAMVLSLLALAHVASAEHARGLQLLFAGTIVTAFFGGWSVPLGLSLPHLADVGLGVAGFALKVAAVTVFAAWLRVRMERQPRSRRAERRWQNLLLFSIANLAISIAWIGF